MIFNYSIFGLRMMMKGLWEWICDMPYIVIFAIVFIIIETISIKIKKRLINKESIKDE